MLTFTDITRLRILKDFCISSHHTKLQVDHRCRSENMTVYIMSYYIGLLTLKIHGAYWDIFGVNLGVSLKFYIFAQSTCKSSPICVVWAIVCDILSTHLPNRAHKATHWKYMGQAQKWAFWGKNRGKLGIWSFVNGPAKMVKWRAFWALLCKNRSRDATCTRAQ